MTVAPAVTPAALRLTFPAFSSTTNYPDEIVQEWIDIATLMLRPERWGTMYATGIKLFAAHNLALNRSEVRTASRGGVPGVNKGPVNNESVSKVSIGFDTQAASELDGGFWNLTTYGTRFLRWARMMGSGGVQVPSTSGLGLPGTPTSGGWGFDF